MYKITYSKFIEDDEYQSRNFWSISKHFKNSRELKTFFNMCKEENIRRGETIFDIDSCSYIEEDDRIVEKSDISFYEKTYKEFLK